MGRPRPTDWTPDANTIQDFEQLLGEEGVKLINEHVVKWAVEEKLADPTVVVADTTTQEAAIPYPNEMNMMAAFVSAVYDRHQAACSPTSVNADARCNVLLHARSL